MKPVMRVLGVSLALTVILFGITSHEANANFIADPNPGGLFFFIDGANPPANPVTSFSGNVGNPVSGPVVDVVTNAPVSTGSGYANISSVVSPTDLTLLTFTPVDPTLFGDFSFRGQLADPGSVTIEVWDNPNFAAPGQSFTFPGLPGNADFQRIGIVSTDGQTIYRVDISTGVAGGFNSVLQVDFSLAQVPEPASLLLIGLGLIGLAGVGRKFRK